MQTISRRKFLAGAGTLVAATSASALLKPFESASNDSQAVRLGYAAITWGTDGRKAIQDISAVGFPGIQLRADAVKQFQAAELRDLLRQHGLTFVALSSGDLHIDPAQEANDMALHTANAKYLRDAGGLYLQIIDKPPKDGTITATDYKRLGKLLTEVGKRSADVGIPVGYHNHMGTLSQEPQNLDQILEAADPRYVKLELDVAHYVQGGGDPVKAIHRYHDRLLFLHLKDVRDADPNTPGVKGPYQWVELGRGRVDLPGVIQALHEVDFRGWAVVELDRVPDKSGTPKESAEINKKYLEDKLGLRL